ncbi:histidine kinase [Pedobacter sp. KBW06]|uniref:FIST signal transduction protein n=1 Tax=Pedobacter sp. KBW06 TaxID=2153359 RepID=UPI000F5B1A07|nr:FIST N-terminal domain-containing protein [Pedobacter sp. KBW06]RQO65377.1 histidine kinase [Pedobacter sp. KBW06]
MNASLFQFLDHKWQNSPSGSSIKPDRVQLVLCFAGKERMTDPDLYQSLQPEFPNAELVMCSTAGEIFGQNVQDNSIIGVALTFDHSRLSTSSVCIQDFPDSYSAAVKLIDNLEKEELCYIMVFSDGSLVNGSELVKGLNKAAGNKVLITGGLAGDGPNFKSTLLGLNDSPSEGKIIAIGFYGKNLLVTHGSQGGWDMFGLEKEITKSEANVLYEIDQENALDLYKKYLGPEVENLPGASLLFPLSVTIPGIEKPVVRTILSIDEGARSMTFAGDVPVGSKVRFMKGNFDKLTAAAAIAAQKTISFQKTNPDFSLLVSCVGRKLILGSRAEDEVEAVSEIFGNETPLAGFYAYGEISPFNEGGDCQLHNQTMTITSFYELP